jgi:hypothetical protein
MSFPLPAAGVRQPHPAYSASASATVAPANALSSHTSSFFDLYLRCE